MPGPKAKKPRVCRVEGCDSTDLSLDASRPYGVRALCCFHNRNAVRRSRGYQELPPPTFTSDEPPSPARTVEEVKEAREKEWERTSRAEAARFLVEQRGFLDGPIGILVFGDPHMDDPGMNYPLFRQHTSLLLETEGLYGGCVGDMQNAWHPKLARLWASQETTAREAWMLVEDWIEEVQHKLLFLVSGNHDLWAKTVNGINPLDWLLQSSPTLTGDYKCRIGMNLPSGLRVIINARHDRRGKSWVNPAHAMLRTMLQGWWDDFILGGHIHEFATCSLLNPITQKPSHGVRVGSYKQIDYYAEKLDFPDRNLSEAAILMIDPYREDPRHRTWVVSDPVRGAEELTFLRERWRKQRKRKRAA